MSTPAGEQLKEWMQRRWPESSRPQRDAADYFGWDETFISKLVRGHRSPGLTNALTIEQRTGIPVEAWVDSRLDKSAERVPVGGRKRR